MPKEELETKIHPKNSCDNLQNAEKLQRVKIHELSNSFSTQNRERVFRGGENRVYLCRGLECQPVMGKTAGEFFQLNSQDQPVCG